MLNKIIYLCLKSLYCILFGKPLRQILIPSRTPLQVNCCITNFESMKPRSNKAKCIEIQSNAYQFKFIFLGAYFRVFIGTFCLAFNIALFVRRKSRRIFTIFEPYPRSSANLSNFWPLPLRNANVLNGWYLIKLRFTFELYSDHAFFEQGEKWQGNRKENKQKLLKWAFCL